MRQDTDATPGALAGEVSGPIQIQQNLLEGIQDISNRYSFTVMVEAHPTTMKAGVLICSGLLVAPRLVLTAGHCVCGQHKTGASSNPGDTIIDNSACAPIATITAMTYLPQKPGENPRALHERYQGEVRPHPELQIVIGPQGELTNVHANLALILLNKPVPNAAPSPKLAESEVQLDEFLITVGYGRDDRGPTLYGDRRFNKSRVVRLSEDHERVLLSPPKRLLYQNDSGGPCLRENPQGDALVGVSNRGLGNEASCLSIYPHGHWLQEEIAEAAQPR